MGTACGEGATETAETVILDGMIFTDLAVDLPCDEYDSGGASRPDEISGVVLRFSDGDGAHLGQATTGVVELMDLDYGCRFIAPYRVSLPVSPFYRVEFEPPPPGESGFYGVEELSPQQIAYEDLKGIEFRWDFEAPPTFEVSDPPCAFDETGCLAARLVVTVVVEASGLHGTLEAVSPIDANSWSQTGIHVAPGSVAPPLATFPPASPVFELSAEGADIVVWIQAIGSSEADEPIHPIEIGSGETVELELLPGEYTLAVSVSGDSGGELRFGLGVP